MKFGVMWFPWMPVIYCLEDHGNLTEVLFMMGTKIPTLFRRMVQRLFLVLQKKPKLHRVQSMLRNLKLIEETEITTCFQE